jgi:hypothetical protein
MGRADVLRKRDRCVSEVRKMRLWPEDMAFVSTILYVLPAWHQLRLWCGP